MFDPYHKWLGIPPQDQPANHYRMLAINLFESDGDVIDAAAEKQMTYVRGCANGPYVAESQKLLNELAAARLCLLNPKKKSEYDQRLKALQPVPENEELASMDLAEFEVKTSRKKKRKSSTKKLPLAAIAPIGVVLLAVVCGIVVLSSKSRSIALSTPPITASPVVPPAVPEAVAVKPQPVAAKVEPLMTPFQQWMNSVAAMSAENQVDAVRKKVQELNPFFDGRVTPKFEEGAVTELAIATDTVSDISPIRSLTRLKFLDCSTLGGASQLSDLSPLKGLSLQRLHANGTNLTDLSPLAGMPLTTLSIANTPVSDLLSLRSLRLVSLDCAGTQISDLSPLQGMPLTYLSLQNSLVSDLLPIKGMPLKLLNLEHTTVADLSPIKGMPLELLGCTFTKVSDLSPIAGMPLKQLYCNDTPISDLSPLAGMTLQRISITPKNIRSGVDALRSMKSLENISVIWVWENQSPPDDFWKRYDAGEFKKS